ncbi:MAG: hypothetical protein Q9160_003897 [Pyrenula sp. 1 TL-2023]
MAVEDKQLAVALPGIRTLLKRFRDHDIRIAAGQRYRALIRKNTGLEVRFINHDATELLYYGFSRQRPRHISFYHFRENVARPFRGFWKACITSLDNLDALDFSSRLWSLARNLPRPESRAPNAVARHSHNLSNRDSGGGCVIFPERLAVFKFKFAGVKLSAFAAYCLIMTGHIQPEDLIPSYQRQDPSSASPAPGFWSSTVSYVLALSVQLTAAAMLAGIARFLVYIVESPLLLPSTILLTLYTLIDLSRHLLSQPHDSPSPSKTRPHQTRTPFLTLTHLQSYHSPLTPLLTNTLNELTALLLEPFTGRLSHSLGTTQGFLTGLTKSLFGSLFCRRKTAVVAFVVMSVQALSVGRGEGKEEEEEDMAFKLPLRQGIREFKGLVARQGAERAREVVQGVVGRWVVVLEGLDSRL